MLAVAGGAHSGEDGNCCGVFKANEAAARSDCLMPMRKCNSLEEAQRKIAHLNHELAALRAQPSASEDLKHALVENAKLRAENQRVRAENQKLRSVCAYLERQKNFKQVVSASPSPAIDQNTML